MKKVSVFYQFTLTALLPTWLLSGCAIWPNLTADEKLDPAAAKVPKCITNNYNEARRCALLTISEISEMLEDTGGFDRTTAYTALGLGTVTGGVLAYDGSEDILKGLAVLSGGLLGLASTVNTKQQRVILQKGLQDMTCTLRAAESLQESSKAVNIARSDYVNANLTTPVRIIAANKTLSILHDANFLEDFKDDSAKALAISTKTQEAIQLESLTRSFLLYFTTLNSAQSSVATKLSHAVIDIRANLRSDLAGLHTDHDNTLKTQSGRVVDIVGEVIRKRADLEKKITEQPVGDEDAAKTASALSMTFVAKTAPILAAFRDCTEPAIQRALEE